MAGVTAQQNDTLQVNYVGSLENGTVFDTSLESEARNAGLPLRSSYSPLEFKVGAGQLIKGFDDAVRGMKEGEEKTIRIPPNEAYGDVNPELIAGIPRANVQGNITIGSMVSGGGNEGKVVSINNETITVDFNHPLAGKVLIFKITLVKITKAQ